ncbi:Hsp70 family protein, partial [Listeria monocytogenes]
RSKSIATIKDNQEQVVVPIYQGESRMVSDNIALGELSVPIPKRKAGEVSLDIRFTYDVNGILEVEAKVHGSEDLHKLVILES